MKTLKEQLFTIAPQFRQVYLEDRIQKEHHKNFTYGKNRSKTSTRKIAALKKLLEQFPLIIKEELKIKKLNSL